MSLNALFEKIAGRQKQREQSRANDFRGLVHALAAGKEPDADKVDAVLQASCKTLADLKAAVEHRRRRLEQRAKLDTLPKLEAEQAELLKQVEKANAALAEAERHHQEAVEPLGNRLVRLKDEIREADRCRQELVSGCADPALLAEAADLAEKLRQARDRENAARQAIDRNKGFAVGGNVSGRFEGTAEQAENARRAHQAGAWERELAEARKLIAALEKEDARLRERMLAP